MKRILSLLLAAMLCIGSSSAVFAAETDSESIEERLAPYIEVINRVNAERGAQIYIPEGEEERVYEYYKGYSLEEFEESLLNDLAQMGRPAKAVPDDDMEMSIEFFPSQDSGKTPDIEPKSVVEDITQVSPISHNSYLYLYSTIFGSGSPVMYHYQSVNRARVGWSSSFTGFHFALSSWSYSLINNRKTCKVTIHGSPQNAAGLVQPVYLTETVMFNAN